MTQVQKAVKVLQAAENQLRSLAAHAAESGDYEAVTTLAAWGRIVNGLIEPAKREHKDLNGFRARGGESSATSPSSPTGERFRVHRKAYPKFNRDAEFLTKTGYSKKGRSEYQHKAPVDLVFVLAECLADWNSSKSLLTAEKLLEACSARMGRVISYQAYVALGWFVESGLLRKHGRSGYSVPCPATVVEDAQKAWNSLSSANNA
jgi:hypothetical protein